MRLNPRMLPALLGLLVGAGAAVAVAQSPNFSSLTTEVEIATSDSPHGLRVVVPLPYREPRRAVLPPVEAERFDDVWPESDRGIGMRTDHGARR
ncbi:hypothetical protein B0I31_109143 [Saccharothrix carnea]|uniref:Uncharacterized protein n=1 Tax=Saccharothrix carnea TaxID=1280637 RepID=A0A2P8I4H5_SACCR|nr:MULTISPECIES: hypothetical protein [Saccharothrix]OKI24932.1 hypothetical protein A6A25_33580 [Saccharothrix sp. CB00851]PSL53353.1 hypothetical protein B0I31_109143 [Saccharothrix carnea]